MGGNREVEEAATTAKFFFEAYYQVIDYTYNYDQSSETTMEILERCKPYLTEKANSLFIENRETLIIYDLARLKEANVSVGKIDLTVVEGDQTNNKIAFNYIVEIELVSPEDGSKNFLTLNGYIETEKEDGSWKVSYIRGHRPRLDI